MRKLTRYVIASLAVAALSGFAAPAAAAEAAPQATRPAAVNPASAVDYTVKVKTGDVESAGTDGYVWANLRGTGGTSGWLRLDNSRDNFERGQLDTFSFTLSDLGRITSIDISFEKSGDSSDWYLDKVTVVDDSESRVFPYYGWIAGVSRIHIPAA